jgi:putative aldouronate transport system substrate-binding protein
VPNIVGVFGISRDSKNPDVAFKLLDYIFASPEAHTLEYWGIQGTDYQVQGGKNVFIGNALDADYREKTGFDPMALPRYQDAGAIRTQFDPWHATIDANMEKWYKAPFPFVYALANEASVLNQYTTDLNTYCDEMFLKFVTGAQSLDTFDSYVQTLKSMSSDQVLAVKQAQYDRFAKK